MSCQNYFYGAEMIIHADRYDEAVEWFEDKFGFDLGESGIDHKLSASGEHMILDLDPIGEVGGYYFFDEFKGFFEEFACDGSYANILTEDDGTWYSRIEMRDNRLFWESYEGQDLFGLAETRIAAQAELLAKRNLVERFSEGMSKFSDVRIWADYSQDGTLRDIRGYAGDDQDDPGELIGYVNTITGQVAYIDQMMAHDPLVQEAVEAELKGAVGKQRPERPAPSENVRTVNIAGDTPREQWTNILGAAFNALRANASSLRTDLGTLRNYLMLYEAELGADYDGLYGLVARNEAPDNIDRIASAIQDEVQRLIDAHVSDDKARSKASSLEDEDKKGFVKNYVRALAAADPDRYGGYAYGGRITLVESEDRSEAYILDTMSYLAINVTGDSVPSIAKSLSEHIMGEFPNDRYLPVVAALEAVDRADHLPGRLRITEADRIDLEPEELAAKMAAQDEWYAAHPQAAERDGRAFEGRARAHGTQKGK